MKRRPYDAKPAQAHCRLCTRLFCYFQKSKRRTYCSPCVEIERRASNIFFSEKARLERIEARETARLIHQEAEIAA